MVRSGEGLTVVSPYGMGLAGYRERIGAWATRLGVPLDAHCYFGDSGTASSFGLSSLPRSMAAEVGLRRLRRSGPAALLMHREASPFSTGSIEGDLLDAADRSAYDIDDALYADSGDENLLRRVFAKAGKAARAVERSSMTLAGNETIANWAQTLNDDVRIVPTCVDPGDYLERTDHEVHDPPRIVWVGSPSTVRHLLMVEQALLHLHRELGASLTVVGGSLAGTGLECMTLSVPWSTQNQRHWLSESDVGIMPVVDGPFERGKCGYKLLQYGAAQLPAVASPVGVNRTIIDRMGLHGPTSDDEWYHAIRSVLEASTAERSAGVTTAHAAVLEHYSFEAWEPVWLQILADLGIEAAAEA